MYGSANFSGFFKLKCAPESSDSVRLVVLVCKSPYPRQMSTSARARRAFRWRTGLVQAMATRGAARARLGWREVWIHKPNYRVLR